MDNRTGTELTLDDDSKYIVVDDFVINNKEYVYLVNEDDTNDVGLVNIENDVLRVIEDDAEFDMVYNELINRKKDEIIEFADEANEN